jgi:hypothetical protein
MTDMIRGHQKKLFVHFGTPEFSRLNDMPVTGFGARPTCYRLLHWRSGFGIRAL